jgi:hypothetical protein
MLTLDEIRLWFEDLSKIIFDINVSIQNIKRISSPRDEYEKKILSHGYFTHVYRQSRFTIIVQLCKIFAEKNNQKRNLYKLFNRLKTDKYDEKMEENLDYHRGSARLLSSREDIQKEISLLEKKIENHDNIIEKIVTLRNRFYAHSDPGMELPQVTNSELELLVKLAIEIFNNLAGKLLDSHFKFDHNSDWKIDYIIKVLAHHNREISGS